MSEFNVKDLEVQRFNNGSLGWVYDPCNKFTATDQAGATVGAIVAHYAGDIPSYLYTAHLRGVTDLKGLVGVIEELYYPLSNIGGEVNPETFAYSYPEDPTLYPIIICRCDIAANKDSKPIEVVFAVYQYSVCYINVNGESMITRID